ncbi:cupin domain-containing protein [Fulvivirgaceae bacterium BMA12]|uniref:Cupin domain-containing protein n=1 Tax=Agaribacillus aureus TaxID=3051825 RepID=A0ABT8LLA6_9BACT|nr:cupin domain-containing protein [Fulvivirgaceae bacterium BMA12]
MKKSETNRNYFGLNFIATGAETNGKYFLSKTIIPAGDPGPPAHAHSKEDESFFLTSGKLKFVVNGEDIELKPGEFLNIEKGEKHTWKNDSNEEAELIITFAPAGIENMFVELDRDISRIKEIGIKYGTDFEL